MATSKKCFHEYTRSCAAAAIIAIFLPQCFGGLPDWAVPMQMWENLIAIAAGGMKPEGMETEMPVKNNSTGRLMAADFFAYTLKALLIGITTSVVLAGAVILLAQSTAQDDTALGYETPAIEEVK